ncbi:RsmB/NOP family class I SAM-dependent RNA methyltransferase [Opitutus terrae]|uniref:Fmu (Sun) domain protein n=1 Tax=Opitutus terrae (strain DSM 11246 / JCM 15787 / PB90-1) TaxID=452637 RepID=B1ZZ48_OPITP|nr:RsmB/NOP family class I SAM-dependent RNA methyltransferase [Opitutus terrae]ACB77120.1 Fmu (Sun) domain protein [Opitutus terrae PB90-1]
MSLAGSQQNTLLAMLARLRPHWRHDRTLPGRVQALLASDRRFGSRDRRLYRELIYTTLRYLPWIEPELERDAEQAVRLIAWLAADAPATAHFRHELIGEWPPCPAPLAEKAAMLAQRVGAADTAAGAGRFAPEALLPRWFHEHCADAFAPVQLDPLLARAPLWLRLQTDEPRSVTAEFEQLGWTACSSAVLPGALQLLDEVDVTRTDAFQNGLIEVQDLGSQLLLAAAQVAAGGHWLDACAGAGGKTLQLAALLGPGGTVDAHDVRRAALDELALRARRAGIPLTRSSSRSDVGRDIPIPAGAPVSDRSSPRAAPKRPAATVRILSTIPETLYDGVLVDAPCSGSGTWRRAPHLKWTTTPAHIDQAAGRQRELLEQFAQRVRPGGRLIYATCSLSRRENQDVVAGFLASRPEFAAEPPPATFGAPVDAFGLTLLPGLHNTDGFFVACMRRN